MIIPQRPELGRFFKCLYKVVPHLAASITAHSLTWQNAEPTSNWDGSTDLTIDFMGISDQLRTGGGSTEEPPTRQVAGDQGCCVSHVVLLFGRHWVRMEYQWNI